MSDRFTVVFKGDIRAFDGNPLHIVSPFGEVAACGEGDAFEAADTIEALRAENARLREALEYLLDMCAGLPTINAMSKAYAALGRNK